MPPKRKIDNVEIRKSARPQSRPKEKFSDVQAANSEKRPRGRPPRRALSPEPENVPEREAPPPSKRPAIKDAEGYCWICHGGWPLSDNDQKCKKCCRMYHYKCMTQKQRLTLFDIHCPECRIKTVDGTIPQKKLTSEELGPLLCSVLHKLQRLNPEFVHWTTPNFNDMSSIRVMDLSIVEDKINSHLVEKYSNTAELLTDVKQISHNCHIIYGAHHYLTNKSKILVKHCREELIDFEACSECYARTHSSDANIFTEVCSVSHDLVWAKMKGFPYWPAKVLKVIDGVANVWFFGSHDKTKIAISSCLWLSSDSPNKKVRNKRIYDLALEEKAEYVENIMKKFRSFQYSMPMIPYDPGENNYTSKASTHQSPAAVTATASRGRKAGRAARGRRPAIAGNLHPDIRSSAVVTEQAVSVLETSPSVVLDTPSDIVIGSVGMSTEDISDIDDIAVEYPLVAIAEDVGNESQEEDDDDVKIIGILPSRRDFPAQLPGRQEAAWSDSTVPGLGTRRYNTGTAISHNLDNDYVHMDFEDGGQTLTDYHPSELIEQTKTPTLEEEVLCVIERLISTIAKDRVPEVIDIDRSSEDALTNMGQIETNYPTYDIHNNEINNTDQIGYNSLYAFPNSPASESSNTHIQVTTGKYANKMMSAIESSLMEMYSELIRATEFQQSVERMELEKKVDELERDKNDLRKSKIELKRNADLVIAKLTSDICADKQAFAEEKEKIEKDFEMRLASAELDFQKASGEAMAKWQAERKDAPVSFAETLVEERVQEAIEAERQKCMCEMEKEITETKKHFWCTNCQAEASFFCCWGTCYCGKKCQSDHWTVHMPKCKNVVENGKSKVRRKPNNMQQLATANNRRLQNSSCLLVEPSQTSKPMSEQNGDAETSSKSLLPSQSRMKRNILQGGKRNVKSLVRRGSTTNSADATNLPSKETSVIASETKDCNTTEKVNTSDGT